jgi:DNA invertase Pin-like site-specific DNA recombinase
MTVCDLYLRLSDFRDTDNGGGFAEREVSLRKRAAGLGWTVGRVVIENDLAPGAASGRARPASAFKRKKIVTPSGRVELRTVRPGFRSILDDLTTGRATAVLAEDLDRAVRDPRDLEDLLDAIAACRGQARSLSGSLTLTDGGTDSEVTMARMMVTIANKSSRDTGRRVAATRARTAADGAYGGGRRPFGYRPDPAAPKYAKTLIMVPAEAAEIRTAAAAVLASAGGPATAGPLKGLARSLRERGIPSVTGAPWSAETLKDILIKPATAGISVYTGHNGAVTEAPASWPPILARDEWEAVRSILTDPGRRTSTSNAPKWLGSGIYLCGRCDDGKTSVHVSGGRPESPGYVCQARSHLRRLAPATDRYVGMVISERLSRGDARDLLAPAPRPGIDAAALRREAAKLTAIGESAARMHSVGDITDSEMAAGSRTRRARLAEIAGDLAAGTAPDPLAEFRGQRDAAAVWKGLPLARQRGVLSALATVTLLPIARRGRGFDPDSVLIVPAAP